MFMLLLTACFRSDKIDNGVYKRSPHGNAGVSQQAAPSQRLGSELPADVSDNNGTVKVALFAPLSGRAAKLGKSFIDAAKLGVFTEGSSNVEILPYDTKGTVEGAIAAANLALRDSPDVIIGPLFSDEVRAVAPLARAANVKVLAFSNDRAVAGKGVYLLGLSPAQQTARIVDYSAKNGIEGFAATQPLNALGRAVVGELKSSARRNGKKVYFTQDYSTFKAPDYTKISASVSNKYSKQGLLNINRFGLVMPESGEALRRLVTSLERNGLTSEKVRFIGTAAWDDSDTYGMYELHNAWFPAVPYSNMRSFMTTFQENFGYRPAQVASLAYDAVLLAAEIGRAGLKGDALTSLQGYYGANGSYRFLANGESERGYDIVEVNRGRIKVVDFAPSYF